MLRLMKSLPLLALVTFTHAIRDDVDEHWLNLHENGHRPAALMQLYEEADRSHRSSSTRSGKGRHHTVSQVRHSAHRRHHARKEYQDDEPEDGSYEDRRPSLSEDSAADGQDDEAEADDNSRQEDVRYEDEQQEVPPPERHAHRSKNARSSSSHADSTSDSTEDSAKIGKPPDRNRSQQPSAPLESNVSADVSGSQSAEGEAQRPQRPQPQDAAQHGWLVTSSCWAILTLVAAAIALGMKRPELAEKGMCFAKRMSKMTEEPEVQRKEVAVQAGEPCHDQLRDQPQTETSETRPNA